MAPHPALACAPSRWLLALAAGAASRSRRRWRRASSRCCRPGKVIQGHAKWEDDCTACHVRFDRAAQDRLCMDCHKDVGPGRARPRPAYHGRHEAAGLPQLPHRPQGPRRADRRARQAAASTTTQTDYVLRGKHVKAECDKCHEPSEEVPRRRRSDCNACHRKDDVHKGALGPKCADCHTENNWKEAKFDHDKTRFALRASTSTPSAPTATRTSDYKDAPRTCIGCHKKDDDGNKGHKGLYGEKCDSCHDAKAWKPSTFNHDTDTKYALRGKHRSTKCADCHTGHLYKVKTRHRLLSTATRRTTSTRRSLGRDCGACHTETRLEGEGQVRPRQDRASRCWASTSTRSATPATRARSTRKRRRTASAATRRTTSTRARWATKCGDCHGERDWKTTKGRFDHDKTKFQLRNAHAATKVKCDACHKDLKQLPRDAAGLLQLPQEGRQARGPARHASARPATTTATGRSPRFDHARRASRWSASTSRWPARTATRRRATRTRRATATAATRRTTSTS